MTTLHLWITGDQLWSCAEYDHGPFCRLCKPVDTIQVAPGSLQRVLGIIDGEAATSDPDNPEPPPPVHVAETWQWQHLVRAPDGTVGHLRTSLEWQSPYVRLPLPAAHPDDDLF